MNNQDNWLEYHACLSQVQNSNSNSLPCHTFSATKHKFQAQANEINRQINQDYAPLRFFLLSSAIKSWIPKKKNPSRFKF